MTSAECQPAWQQISADESAVRRYVRVYVYDCLRVYVREEEVMDQTASLSLGPHFARQRDRVNEELNRLLPPVGQHPESIREAMRYSIFVGGKRVRPLLLLETGEAFGGAPETLLQAAAAVEMVHTYSLVHDDLPAMDNDSLRRGMPTNHVKFGEATAILAGDGLLTLAFEVLAGLPADPSIAVRAIRILSAAIGTVDGMIAGQILDMKYEGSVLDQAMLEQLHRAKTGALIRASIQLGALLGGADSASLQALSHGTAYFWRVQAIDAAGNPSGWSAPFTLNID